MKFKFLSFLFLGLTSLCTNQDEKPDIIGSWTWVESSGGFAGKTINPETTGDSISIVFTKKKYKYFIITCYCWYIYIHNE